jgi:hypothetical protein
MPGTNPLWGVQCVSVSSCVAVGTNSVDGLGVVVPVTNGDPGSVTTVNGTHSLQGVACESADSCLAVGLNIPGYKPVGILAPVGTAVWSDNVGTVQSVQGTSILSGVACGSTTSCEAVGTHGSKGVVLQISLGVIYQLGQRIFTL